MTDARALLKERFGDDIEPLTLTEGAPLDGGRRARFVATLHALIAFFLEHDVPVPHSISFSADVPTLAELEALALAFGTTTYPHGEPAQISLYPIGSHGDAELYVPFHIAIERPDRPL